MLDYHYNTTWKTCVESKSKCPSTRPDTLILPAAGGGTTQFCCDLASEAAPQQLLQYRSSSLQCKIHSGNSYTFNTTHPATYKPGRNPPYVFGENETWCDAPPTGGSANLFPAAQDILHLSIGCWDERNNSQYTCSSGDTYDTYDANSLCPSQKTKAEQLFKTKDGTPPASYYACVQGCKGRCSPIAGSKSRLFEPEPATNNTTKTFCLDMYSNMSKAGGGLDCYANLGPSDPKQLVV